MIVDIFTIIGLTAIITTSRMLKPFREWATRRHMFFGDLLGCSMCTGFWVGLFIYFCPEIIVIDLTNINIKFIFNIFVKEIISYAAIGSISSEVIYLIMQRLKLK